MSEVKKVIVVGGGIAGSAAALRAALPGHLVTQCNDDGTGHAATYLCGTTNVQGRHLNGTADACSAPALSATERFVHIEQSRAVRGDAPGVVSALRVALGF